MISINQIVDQFRISEATAYLETFPFDQLMFERVFPLQYTPNLTFEGIEAYTGAKVAADIVAFNSRAPRKGRPIPGSISGEIPKIEIARDKDEKAINNFRRLQQSLASTTVSGSARSIRGQIFDWMYEDSAFVVDGINARLEWLAKRILSTGQCELTITNNEAGVQTKNVVDFGIPTANRKTVTKSWSDPTSEPIKDIRERAKVARAKGKPLRFMYTDQDVFNTFAENPSVQKFCASFALNALNLAQEPDLAAVNAALRRNNLPEFIIWDSFVTIEGKDGTQTSESGWEPDTVVFTRNQTVGNTQHTMSADEFMNMGVAQKTKSGIVLVKTWGIEDPITVITKGVAYSMPVMVGALDVHILDTKV